MFCAGFAALSKPVRIRFGKSAGSGFCVRRPLVPFPLNLREVLGCQPEFLGYNQVIRMGRKAGEEVRFFSRVHQTRFPDWIFFPDFLTLSREAALFGKWEQQSQGLNVCLSFNCNKQRKTLFSDAYDGTRFPFQCWSPGPSAPGGRFRRDPEVAGEGPAGACPSPGRSPSN